MSQSALAVGLDAETTQRMLALLSGRGIAVDFVSQGLEAVQRATLQRFDLVTCAYPLPDMVLREFSGAMRHSSSASRDAALLVLTLPEMRAEAHLALSGGRSLVMSRRDPRPVMVEAVRHLLQVEPRRRLEATATLRVDRGGTPAKVAARLVNVSRSGMLIRHQEPPGIGTRCDFELLLADRDESVRGCGEVVRHSSPTRERVLGFALRFLSLEEGSRQLLDAGLATAS
jgi:CheY-like chemotaxis protein